MLKTAGGEAIQAQPMLEILEKLVNRLPTLLIICLTERAGLSIRLWEMSV